MDLTDREKENISWQGIAYFTLAIINPCLLSTLIGPILFAPKRGPLESDCLGSVLDPLCALSKLHGLSTKRIGRTFPPLAIVLIGKEGPCGVVSIESGPQ